MMGHQRKGKNNDKNKGNGPTSAKGGQIWGTNPPNYPKSTTPLNEKSVEWAT
jgi:hypothetical protein